MVSLFKFVAPLLAVCASVAAQNKPLAVIHPGFGEVVNANNDFTITWDATSSVSTVNLILRAGGAQNLTTLYTIASGIENSGEYKWSVPASATSNTDYSIMIQDASNTDTVNFSAYFTVLAVGQGITSSGVSASGSQTASASASGSESASASASGSDSESASGSASGSATESASGSASASGTASGSASKSASGSGSATTSAESSAAQSSAAASGSSAESSSAASSGAAGHSSNAAQLAAGLGGSVLAGLAGVLALVY